MSISQSVFFWRQDPLAVHFLLLREVLQRVFHLWLDVSDLVGRWTIGFGWSWPVPLVVELVLSKSDVIVGVHNVMVYAEVWHEVVNWVTLGCSSLPGKERLSFSLT